MALTANARREIRKSGQDSGQVLDAEVIYAGAYLALGHADHGTPANVGRVYAYNDEEGAIPFGRATPTDSITGDTGATPIPEVEIDHESHILENHTVAGLSAVTEAGTDIFLTDDDVMTQTRPTLGIAQGFVIDYKTGAIGDVFMYSTEAKAILALAGAGQYTWHLGVVVPELVAAGDLLTGIVVPHHGVITSVYAICASAPADANMHMVIQLEIEGANLTGGEITLDFADTVGLKIAGTAVTDGNVVHEGDLIDVEALAAGFEAGTVMDGLYNIYVEFQNRLGT